MPRKKRPQNQSPVQYINQLPGTELGELQRAANRLGLKANVINADLVSTANQRQILLHMLKRGYSIILFIKLRNNADTRRNPSGHYVSLIPYCNNTKIEFYDPAGQKPTAYPFRPWLYQLFSHFVAITGFDHATQPMDSTACGAWNLIRIGRKNMSRQQFREQIHRAKYS